MWQMMMMALTVVHLASMRQQKLCYAATIEIARSLFPHRCWVLFCFSSTSHRLNRLLFYVYFVNCYKQFHPPPHRAHNTNGGCSFRLRRPSISLPSQSCCYCLCCLACLVIFIESRLSMALLHIFRLFFIVVYLLCVMSCVVSTVYVYDA